MWEKKEDGEMPEHSNAQVNLVMNDKARQLKSLAETILKARCVLILGEITWMAETWK